MHVIIDQYVWIYPLLLCTYVQETVPYPRAKSAKVGEVGWGVVKLMDCTLLKSGHQIMVHIALLQLTNPNVLLILAAQISRLILIHCVM